MLRKLLAALETHLASLDTTRAMEMIKAWYKGGCLWLPRRMGAMVMGPGPSRSSHSRLTPSSQTTTLFIA